MEASFITKVEQKEFDEINAILPRLWNENLLTDIDCRIIASANKLAEKKEVLYTIIMSKTKEEAAILTETFRKMTESINTNENSIIVNNAGSNEENKGFVLSATNPLLDNVIVKHLFGFLTLKDMKRSRLVCRRWNSTAEICLRKRSLIHFRPNVVLPQTFMEISKYSLPDLPFASFAFSSVDEDSIWRVSDIENFLKKWEKNIKEVTFNSIALGRQCNSTGTTVPISNYHVTPLFINPANITSLKIRPTDYFFPITTLDIALEQFVSIKILSLSYCRIIVPAENQRPLIAPWIVNIQNVDVMQNAEMATNFNYNDFVDFSKALNINLEQEYMNNPVSAIFDMGKQILNVNELHLFNVALENLTLAKGNVQSLYLTTTPYLEKNQLKFKKLKASDCTIELSALSPKLQSFEMTDCEILCSEPIHLPNLKYLRVHGNVDDSLTHFSNCPNLVELAIDCRIELGPAFNLAWIPKSVKIMTLKLPQAKFIADSILELDTLNLHTIYDLVKVEDILAITAQINAKVLVVVSAKRLFRATSDIIKLVLAHQQSEKILIGSNSVLHKKTAFEASELSKYVDRKSNFYEFKDNVGKSLTKEEFVRYTTMGDYFPSKFFESL